VVKHGKSDTGIGKSATKAIVMLLSGKFFGPTWVFAAPRDFQPQGMKSSMHNFLNKGLFICTLRAEEISMRGEIRLCSQGSLYDPNLPGYI
jgi:hypothetical protein